jgi:preprotein translocase subunit SecY
VLTAFGRAFRTPDLRRKLLFTLAIMALFRSGRSCRRRVSTTRPCAVRRPGRATPTERPVPAVNLFSGGALLQLSVFALGIMPYITASIIIQLLTVVIPRFEALKEEGQTGTSKLTQYTRYLTIGLARPAVDDVRGDRPHAGACSSSCQETLIRTTT